MSSYFAPYLDMPCRSLDTPMHVSTLVGEFIVVEHVYQSCVVTICGYVTSVDLLLLNIVEFDMILVMD